MLHIHTHKHKYTHMFAHLETCTDRHSQTHLGRAHDMHLHRPMKTHNQNTSEPDLGGLKQSEMRVWASLKMMKLHESMLVYHRCFANL